MKKRDFAKGIVGTAVSLGTGMVVGRFCGLALGLVDTGKFGKVCIYAASIGLSGAASERAVAYTDKSIDEIGELYDEIKGVGKKPNLTVVGDDKKGS